MEAALYISLLTILGLGYSCHGDLEFVYHNHEAVKSYLHDVTQRYPALTHLYSIGKSVQGRDLYVVALGASPREHILLRPEVKYVANIHGNEVTGREILLHFIERLVTEYNVNTTITELLNTMRVHILVSINPDGFENATNNAGEGNCTGAHGRANANGFDLNRNFPDYFENERIVDYQPESRALMDWITSNQFVLSAQLHDGALVANYPYDSYAGAFTDPQAMYSLSPDDDVFKHLSKVYSRSHTSMYLGEACWGDDEGFPGGIVNGAKWYPVVGGLQDFNYIFGGCMELTLELSCCKYSYSDELPSKWRENKEALVTFLQQVHRGVKGIVRNTKDEPISKARVSVVGRDSHYVNTTEAGEFWKILLPGNYTLKVTAAGYESIYREIVVLEAHTTVLEITIPPLAFYFSGTGSGILPPFSSLGIVFCLLLNRFLSFS